MNNTFTFTIKRWQAGVVIFTLFSVLNIFANKLIYKMSPFNEYIFIVICVVTLVFCCISFLLYNAFKNVFAEFSFPKFYKRCSFIFNILWAVLLCITYVLFINLEFLLPLIGNNIGRITSFAFKLLFAFTLVCWVIAMLTPQKSKLTAFQSILLPAVQFSTTAAYICFSGYDKFLQNVYLFIIAPVLIAFTLLLLIFFAKAIFTKRKVTQ